MDPLMRAVKAVYAVKGDSASISADDLKKQRNSMDAFSKLATPPVGTHTEEFLIDDIPCEWIYPDLYHDKKHVILYCHGGGYTCGRLPYARILGSKMALACGIRVLSFEYRLAPEYQYPAALEDAIKVWDYLMMQGYGASNVIISGDSAGGNLALETCISLKERGRMLPKGMILYSPWTDMTLFSESYTTRKNVDPMITTEFVEAVRGAYLGDRIDFDNPYYSPLFADLSDFPVTYVQVGDNEILLDDSLNLVNKMQKSGTLAKVDVFEDGWHVFQQMPIVRAHKAISQVADFIQNII